MRRLRHRSAVVCWIVTIVLLVSSCIRPAGAADFLRSEVERESSPNVSDVDLGELARGNNAFAMDLYQACRERGSNFFYSPYSISVALAMTYAGARGETERQMKATLHFTLPNDRLHAAFNAVDHELAQRGERRKDDDPIPFELHVANSIWGQKGYEFLPAFLDLLAENYGAGLRLVDFVKDSEASRLAINDWVSDQTKEQIQDLIPRGVIDSVTRLVLANAIYFKASWVYQFDRSRTQDAPFHLLTGEEVQVPMMGMSKAEGFGYARGEGYQAVQLPYVGNQVAMTIIIPQAGSFAEFEAGLDAGQLEEILAGVKEEMVRLRLPRFSYESSFELADTLARMGMPEAMSMDADFSGMDGTEDLFIEEVMHKAFVAVDEAGTEAAAATAVIMSLAAMPPEEAVELTIDHPFIFLISHLETGTTLFVGRVLNPLG